MFRSTLYVTRDRPIGIMILAILLDYPFSEHADSAQPRIPTLNTRPSLPLGGGYGSREGHRFALGVRSLEFGVWRLTLGVWSLEFDVSWAWLLR